MSARPARVEGSSKEEEFSYGETPHLQQSGQHGWRGILQVWEDCKADAWPTELRGQHRGSL